MRIGKWVRLKKELKNFNLYFPLSNWEAGMVGGCLKVRKHERTPPPMGALTLNVDGAARGKRGRASIGGVLCNHGNLILFSFSSFIGVKDLNEAEILAILEAIRLFNVSFWQPLIMESDSLNTISWVSNVAKGRWKFYFSLNEFGVGCVV